MRPSTQVAFRALRTYRFFMLTRSRFAAAALFTLCATLLFAETAGAPLKGVVVKLGRNPGNAGRTMNTGENGVIDLGTLEKGSYFLVFTAAPRPSDDPVVVEVEISGAPGKPTTYRYNRKAGSILLRNGAAVTHPFERKASEPEKMTFNADGEHAMRVTIVKSKSNIPIN